MPTFWYKAAGHENTPAEGTIAAASRREALQRLIASGQHPIELREHSDGQGATGIQFNFGRRPVRLATFTRQLATLAATGAPIIKGLAVISEQTRDPRAKQVLTDVAESVQGGSTFADALGKHPKVFPNLMTNMVRVGEMGGIGIEFHGHATHVHAGAAQIAVFGNGHSGTGCRCSAGSAHPTGAGTNHEQVIVEV